MLGEVANQAGKRSHLRLDEAMTIGRAGLLILIAGLLPGWLLAGEEPGPRAVDYTREIKPVLSKRCYACHGALQQKAGLRLDTAAFMKKGGDSGPAIEPGSSDESLIIDAVTGADGWRMPPESEGSPLSADEIARLKAWIDQGARSPADELPQPDPRRHWSFQPIRRPEVPSARHSATQRRWVRNPIDAFLAAEHRKHGLKPRPAADPATLIRRVCLDLTGLVPSPELVRAFVADPSDRAYEALVDRLLASPQYGERWGRHWMDVWRYSDWDGFGAEVRESQPHIWRWRDWIVESLNRDLPYDRMIVAMLAADETDPCDAELAPRHRLPGAQLVQVQSQRLAGRHRRAHRQGVSGHHAQLRQMPRSQVRPDRPDRLLRLPGFLRALHGSHRPGAGPARYHQGRAGAGL